jgi:hypothetical protein
MPSPALTAELLAGWGLLSTGKCSDLVGLRRERVRNCRNIAITLIDSDRPIFNGQKPLALLPPSPPPTVRLLVSTQGVRFWIALPPIPPALDSQSLQGETRFSAFCAIFFRPWGRS